MSKFAVVEKQFEYKGHDCICIFGCLGYRCGYVSVDDNKEFVKVKWYGYDDDFWWYNVSITEQAQIRVGSDGRKYRIDFKTNRVSEVEE